MRPWRPEQSNCRVARDHRCNLARSRARASDVLSIPSRYSSVYRIHADSACRPASLHFGWIRRRGRHFCDHATPSMCPYFASLFWNHPVNGSLSVRGSSPRIRFFDLSSLARALILGQNGELQAPSAERRGDLGRLGFVLEPAFLRDRRCCDDCHLRGSVDFDTTTIALGGPRAVALSHSSRDRIGAAGSASFDLQCRRRALAKFLRQADTANLLHSIKVVIFGGDFGVTLILVGGLLITVLYYSRRLMGDDQLAVTEVSTPGRRAFATRNHDDCFGVDPHIDVSFRSDSHKIVQRALCFRGDRTRANGGRMCARKAARRKNRGCPSDATASVDLLHKTRPDPGVYGGIIPTLERYTRDSTLPIVIDDGVFYLQVLYAADPDMRSRMTLLTVPDQPPRDPTDQNHDRRTSKYVDYVPRGKTG